MSDTNTTKTPSFFSKVGTFVKKVWKAGVTFVKGLFSSWSNALVTIGTTALVVVAELVVPGMIFFLAAAGAVAWAGFYFGGRAIGSWMIASKQVEVEAALKAEVQAS